MITKKYIVVVKYYDDDIEILSFDDLNEATDVYNKYCKSFNVTLSQVIYSTDNPIL